MFCSLSARCVRGNRIMIMMGQANRERYRLDDQLLQGQTSAVSDKSLVVGGFDSSTLRWNDSLD